TPVTDLRPVPGTGRVLTSQCHFPQAGRVVDVEAALLRQAEGGQLARDHRGQRAQPLRDARDERELRVRAAEDRVDVRDCDDPRADANRHPSPIAAIGPCIRSAGEYASTTSPESSRILSAISNAVP